MGCNGSKHKSGAQDPVCPKKKSELPRQKPALEVIPETEVSGDSAESGKEVKDIAMNKVADAEGSGELKKADEEKATGKLISRESPERYFSSRKEEDAIVAVGGEGSEYFSPRFVPDHGGTARGEDDASKAAEETHIADVHCIDRDKENRGGAKENVVMGKSSTEVVDVKVHILIEETREQLDTIKNQTIHVNEGIP